MKYASPRTWAAGDVITYAALNQELRDDVAFLYSPPSVRVYAERDFPVPHNQAVDVPFTSERWDTDNMHSIFTGREQLTVRTTGKYRIGACVRWAAQATYAGMREIAIKLNGDRLIVAEDEFTITTFGNSVTIIQNIQTIWHCRGTDNYRDADTLSLQVFQTSGDALSLSAAGNYSAEMWATWRSG